MTCDVNHSFGQEESAGVCVGGVVGSHRTCKHQTRCPCRVWGLDRDVQRRPGVLSKGA